MSTNQREERLRNMELARIKTETERIKKKSVDADTEIEALKRKMAKFDEEMMRKIRQDNLRQDNQMHLIF
ncbi:hypothetical protein CAEBREN_14215 [Caenorhabditis brenneri]|uniref:Uncharacterized protein n=1 Tax=Caenorhabditis brenneri TaxID=135651 RepID=G0PE77_CAEBE|nr:hypothetical protein CAEBREN_14215 [Caenorhabditis brenneri]